MSENKTVEKSLIPKMTKFGKWVILILLAFILIWPLSAGFYWTVYKAYTLLDSTRFPKLDQNLADLLQKTAPTSSQAQKGAVLSASIRNRLEQEMNSTFGWSVNDLLISPTRWLDNRANRQRGVIFATRMLITYFSTNLAKYGQVDAENEDLKEARETYFAFTADSWWFPSSEDQYEKGIKLLKKYEADLVRGDSKAIFNMRTDDMYNMLTFIISKPFLDQPLGLLVQSNDEVPYTELDDQIYYTQGVILALRDVLRAFVHLYPEIQEKGGNENIKIAFREMDQICTFDPLIVLRGKHDSIMADHRGKMAKYLISVRERINDLAQSIKS
ncbi:MAG: DUF2333 family protein [Desulfobacteraceae bacterium]|jgi:hypothetical protein|nr:DUF2333 family protein [Desulfobacteraceae bacterium]